MYLGTLYIFTKFRPDRISNMAVKPGGHLGKSTSSSSAFTLAWRNYSPWSITPPRFYEHFCVPLRLDANWGYWPSDSVFDQGGGVHHKLLCFSLGWGLLLALA
jgi:hypothetical protein